MSECIFCKIIRGEVKSYKIYEDDYCVAFLDINPINPGHTLVVTKKHVENILSADEEILRNLLIAVKNVSKILMEKLNASGVNILHNVGKAANQEIMHLHVHVIPRYSPDDIGLVDWWRSAVKKNINLEEIYRKIVG